MQLFQENNIQPVCFIGDNKGTKFWSIYVLVGWTFKF